MQYAFNMPTYGCNMNTVRIEALLPGVALPPAARHFEKRHHVNAFRLGVALPAAARYFEKS